MRKLLTVTAVVYAVAFLLVVRTQSAPQALPASVAHGRDIFRYDTFGDEQLWTTTLRMHEVVGSVPPATALDVGLKVDSQALPPSVVRAIKGGHVDLNDPAVTVL